MTIHSKDILWSPLLSRAKLREKKNWENSHSHLLANEELKGQKGAGKKKEKAIARITVCLASSLPPGLAEEEMGS